MQNPNTAIAISSVVMFAVWPTRNTNVAPINRPVACTVMRPPAKRRDSLSASKSASGTLTALARGMNTVPDKLALVSLK